MSVSYKSLTGFFFIFFFLLVLTPVSAQTYQQDTDVDIKVSCLNIDCGTTTEISIEDPNTNLLVDNETMTQKDGFVNYTFSNTSDFGTYNYYLISQGGTPEFYEDDFTITANGEEFQKFPNQFFLILLSVLMIFGSYASERLGLFRYLGSVFLMVLGVITIYPGYNFMNHTNILGTSLGIVLVALGFYFLIEDSFSRNKEPERFKRGVN